ncbi:hypothetical protein BC351_00950 [Paenibacillus ferrarius]|uniref:HPr domain-containing protein n=1 Tax=Paenibacillus ferrarius TaxID=1469647 RepID=A0A1V4HSE2_9BACL|nr:HPr family phosphocarrier protein [Paenibacillus ferrarius]OPH61840.1 hypothetical protein BC351_00950 [Paenibacillus ferrarius]
MNKNILKVKVLTEKIDTKFISKITHAAGHSTSTVEVSKKHIRVDSKSILGLFTLGLRSDDEITFTSDDQEVLEDIAALFA